MLGTTEWIIIGLVIFLFFGAAKIPELARSFGQAKAEFNKAARGATAVPVKELVATEAK